MKLNPTYSALPPISSGSKPRLGLPLAVKAPKIAIAGANHWSIFWRDFGEGSERPERCHIPGDGRPAVDRHWSRFAADLPSAARVIDIGCGAGTVGRMLLGLRTDLNVTGVDFAEVPMKAPPNLALHPWVSMEDLPFEDGTFDAAVSLFGIEYGSVAETAQELRRVLIPGGLFSFVIHHCDSEIAREGRARVLGIRDALSGKVKAAFLAGDLARFEQQRRRLGFQHPDEPTVKLISDYFHRNIRRARGDRLGLWLKLEADVEVEVSLTTQMTKSAKSATQMGSWLVPMLSVMSSIAISVLRRGSGEPIGWIVEGVR